MVDLPAVKNSGDEHPMEPAVKQLFKPKKKRIPLPVAQPKHCVDVNEHRDHVNIYEDVIFDKNEPLADHQVLICT